MCKPDYVHMCMHMCGYECVYMHTCMDEYVLLCLCVYTSGGISVHVYAHIHVCLGVPKMIALTNKSTLR